MSDPLWLDRVQNELARHVLPPSYVQRFVEELSDHLDDLQDQAAETTSRMGEPEHVAQAAVVTYRRRNFLGRHPLAAFLVFAISPAIAWCVLVATCLVVFYGAHSSPIYTWWELYGTFTLVFVVSSTYVGTFYDELALRLGIGKKWMFTSATTLGVTAGLLEWVALTGFDLQDVVLLVQEDPTLIVSTLLAQFAAPLAATWWFLKRQGHPGYPATTFLVFALSPVASCTLLLIMALIAAWAVGLLCAGATLLAVWIAAIVAGLVVWKLTQEVSRRKRWLIASCLTLAILTLGVLEPQMLLLGSLCTIPTAVSGLVFWRLTQGMSRRKRWWLSSCLTLAILTLALTILNLEPLLLLLGPFCAAPMAVASLLYCRLVRRLGLGRKWMWVSCVVVAWYAAWQSSPGLLCLQWYESVDSEGLLHVSFGLWAGVTLIQCLAPLAIGGWFVRRTQRQGQLQVAA